MKRAITAAAILAAFALPERARAQEAAPAAPAAEASDPAVVEPEGGSIDLAEPAPQAPAGEPKSSATSHTVQPGDTLWDLSQKYLGTPWYWPKVWSYNPEIENPHWIYPGNVIRFQAAADELPAMVDAAPAGAEGDVDDPMPQMPTEVGDVTVGTMDAPDLLGQDEDVVAIAPGVKMGYTPPKQSLLRQDGLITQRELDEAGVIDRAWAEIHMLSTYDKVYLRFKNKGSVRIGERYSIFRTSRQIVHPVTRAPYGYMTNVLGTLRVVSMDADVVVAIIEQTLDDIHRGDFVAPLGKFDKRVLTKANARRVQGVILASMIPDLPYMGEHHVVFIDKGSRDGVEEGNTFSVVRRGDPLAMEHSGEDGRRLPPEDVATIVVIDVKDTASAGLVVRSMREISIGETVVMKPANASQASAQ